MTREQFGGYYTPPISAIAKLFTEHPEYLYALVAWGTGTALGTAKLIIQGIRDNLSSEESVQISDDDLLKIAKDVAEKGEKVINDDKFSIKDKKLTFMYEKYKQNEKTFLTRIFETLRLKKVKTLADFKVEDLENFKKWLNDTKFTSVKEDFELNSKPNGDFYTNRDEAIKAIEDFFASTKPEDERENIELPHEESAQNDASGDFPYYLFPLMNSSQQGISPSKRRKSSRRKVSRKGSRKSSLRKRSKSRSRSRSRSRKGTFAKKRSSRSRTNRRTTRSNDFDEQF